MVKRDCNGGAGDSQLSLLKHLMISTLLQNVHDENEANPDENLLEFFFGETGLQWRTAIGGAVYTKLSLLKH